MEDFVLENILIDVSDSTPKVILDYNNGLIEFEGRSYPENTFEFYENINAWLKKYFDGNAKNKTIVNFKFTYFNSATSQILFDILDIINEGEKHDLLINWYYDSSNSNGLDDYEDYAAEFEDLSIQAIAYE
jgi:hypothetical protein